MTIIHWPTQERPREKLLSLGSTSLSDAELLAIFLRTGVRGKSAVDVGRELLQQFGSLRTLLETSKQSFCQFHGVGSAKYTQLQAALELGKRYLREPLHRLDTLSNPQETCNYLTAKLRGYKHEVFACLFLDARHRLISYDELFHGTINNASVHPREVVKRALGHNASALILAHNHPSGVSEPSAADRHITQCLKSALELVDVQVLDHIIIGDGEVTSLAERGLM